MLIENIKEAFQNLLSNKMRSLLTMLGIIIGISAVITITTIGTSIKSTLNATLNSLGGNSISASVDAIYPEDDADWSNWEYPKMTADDYITQDMLDELQETYPDEIAGFGISAYLGSGQIYKNSDKYANVDATGTTKEELEHMQRQEIEKLEAISGLSAEEAKERMVESLKEEAKTQAQSYINDIMDDAKLTASKEAKRIVIQSIQRVATETAIENSVTVFHIESDEIKGRIIGREGRNIRALEAATGVEIVVDDTPEAIVLSAFDPVRREIARLALHQLVTDGRIHPARIEEVVAKVRKQVEEEIIETGKRTTIDLGIHG